MANKFVMLNDDEEIRRIGLALQRVPVDKLFFPTAEEVREARMSWTDQTGKAPRVETLDTVARVQMTVKSHRFVLVSFPYTRSEVKPTANLNEERAYYVNRDECFLRACVLGDAAWYYISAVTRRAVTLYAFSYALAEKNAQVPEVAEALERLAQHLLNLGLIKPRASDALTKKRTTVSKVMDAKFDEADKRLRKNLNILVEHQDKQHAALLERLAIIEAKLDGRAVPTSGLS